jgi:hypothetical protein
MPFFDLRFLITPLQCFTCTVLCIKKYQSETDDEYEKKVYVVVFNYYPINSDKSLSMLKNVVVDLLCYNFICA